MTKTLSYILPNYNHSVYLKSCLEAILSQSRPADEILVVDDASTDRSVEIIQAMAKKHSTIRLICHEKNQGAVAAFMTGVHAAQSAYVALGSADDLIFPAFFEVALAALQQNPECGLFCSRICFFENSRPGVFQEEKDWLSLKTSQVFSPQDMKHLFRTTNFRISSPSAMYKKDSFLRLGGYRKEALMLCDWLLNCEIALQEGLVYVPQIFAAVRKADTPSYSSQIYQNRKKREGVYAQILLYIKEHSSYHLYKKSLMLYQLGWEFLLYLCKKPLHWHFIPGFVGKKARLFITKPSN